MGNKTYKYSKNHVDKSLDNIKNLLKSYPKDLSSLKQSKRQKLHETLNKEIKWFVDNLRHLTDTEINDEDLKIIKQQIPLVGVSEFSHDDTQKMISLARDLLRKKKLLQ